MISVGCILNVVDNTGAKTGRCIKVPGGSKRKYASVGDVIVIAIQESSPTSKIKEGEVYKGLITGCKYPIRRKNGTTIRFSQNNMVVLNKNGELLGTRISSPVSNELRANYSKVVSLAPEVV